MIKNFLAIMDAIEEWHHLLEGVQHDIIMYLDHKNLQYFMTTHVLNQCQPGGHYPCFDSSLSSHIGMGANKGNLMHCPITCTLRLKKEMSSMSNNVMSFSNLNIFNFMHFK
jgi:hypothetical protein